MMPKKIILIALLITILVFIGMGAYYLLRYYFNPGRWLKISAWMRDPQAHPEWAVKAGERCGDAPFLIPTDGLIGYLWSDSFRPGHHHQGIDIFSGTPSGQTAVVAVYDGYLTRLPEWKSSLIIRIPQDPLQPDRQIWTYYTHLADDAGNSLILDDYPPGTQEVFVRAGTVLGFQGDYSGNPDNPVGVHLHFSIVKDDGTGHFLNELKITNTLDPSQYFMLSLNARDFTGDFPSCNLVAQ